MFTIYDGRAEFYQWDKDRKLIVKDSSIKEVHFCNKTEECSLVCDTYTENDLTLVNVPNILLQTAWKIRVYGYTGDFTKYEECFKVNARSKPADYIYTETEIRDYNQFVNDVETLKSDVESINNELIGVYDSFNYTQGEIYRVERECREELNFVTGIATQDTERINTLELDVEKLKTKHNKYSATTATLKNILQTAEPNSIIELKQGAYPLLELKGQSAYAEGITIVGGSGVTMAGVCITSGVTDKEINSAYKNNAKYECCNPDTNNAVMPKGLTFKSINFTNSFSLRNCQLDDLSIISCNFAENCYIAINPNRLQDIYGNDYNGSKNFETRRTYAKVTPRNLVIKHCVFEGVTGTEQSSSGDACILVKGVDGISIYKNKMKKASYSGITVSGVNSAEHWVYSTGKIAITNNEISNTGATSINLYDVKNAEITVAANTLKNANLTHAHEGYITLANSFNCAMAWTGKNGYTNFPNSYSDDSGTVISTMSVGNGIALSNVTETDYKEIKALQNKIAELEKIINSLGG